MAYSLNFDDKLKEALEEAAPQYQWDTGWNADERSRVDVVGMKASAARVLVEVELKKDNPVENVVKIWNWAKDKRKTHPILFVQAFSAHYLGPKNNFGKTSKGKQFERSKFVGERMRQDKNLNIDYKTLPIYSTTRLGQRIPFRPRLRRGFVTKTGGTSMHRAAQELAKDIAALLRSKSRR